MHCVTLSITLCSWGKKSILCRVWFEIFVEVQVWKCAASAHLSHSLAGGELYFLFFHSSTSVNGRFLFSCVIIDLDFTEKRWFSPDRASVSDSVCVCVLALRHQLMNLMNMNITQGLDTPLFLR